MALDLDKVGKNIKKLRRLLRKTVKRPSAKHIHQLRTRTRRAEAAFHTLGVDSHKNERRLLARLKRVRSRAGKVRDMDVLTGHLLSTPLKGEEDCEVELLHYIGARRYRQSQRLRRRIRQYDSELRRRLKRSVRRIVRLRDKQARNAALPARRSSKTAGTALQLSNHLGDPAVLNQKNLHEYRLKIKELRDVLQMAQSEADPELIGMLGDCRDVIGEWHDWGELETIAGKRLAGKSGHQALKKLAAIRQKKYDAAIAIANQLRKRYVPRPVRSRAGTHSAGKFSRPAPVLRAVAALVQ